MVTDYDIDPDWKEELGEYSWYVYDANHVLDRVKSFEKFLQVREYYQRYNSLTERIFITSPRSTMQEELSPEIFLTAVLKSYGCFAGLKGKERKAMEQLILDLPIVSRVFADPRLPTGLVKPIGWTSWAINTWQHPKKTTDTKSDDPAVADAVRDVMELFARHFLVAAEHDQIIGYIAHALQKPWERPQWHPLIRGVKNTGKSVLFVKILRAIFGQSHVNEQTDLSKLDKPETVSGWLSSLFVVCDDFLVTTRNQAEDLKHMMTAPRLESRRLYQNATQEEVFTRFIFMSNWRQPIKFVTEDRRFFVTQFCNYPVDSDESIKFVCERILPLLDEYGNFKDPRVKDALIDFFQNYPLDNFNPSKPLETEDHRAMCGTGSNTKEVQIQDFIDRYPVATYKSFRDFMNSEYQTYIGDTERCIWEKLMRESSDKWVLVGTSKDAKYKAQLSRSIGPASDPVLNKGKKISCWCREPFLENFTDNMQQLYTEDEAYIKTLYPKK